MKRIGLLSFALITALLIGVGCHAFAQNAPAPGPKPASGAKTQAPKTPPGMSFVSDDGKSTLASFHVAYAKGGPALSINGPTGKSVQLPEMSKDRLPDTDTLLLVFDIKNWISVDPNTAVVAQDGTKYVLLQFYPAKPEPNSGNGGMLIMSQYGTIMEFDLGPTENSANKTFILNFRLPPPSSHLTVKGIEGFSHIEFDVK